MRTLIYIGEWRVDQYKDESVNLVSSVLDITDITKNAGDYTKTFTVPASKRNNILFKHWYDANIDNSFDARTKVNGRIIIDGLPFKVGKFRLAKVSVKKNKPDSYTINFFGNSVDLKDTLGKDELTSLDLSSLDHDYNATNIKNGLGVGGLFSGDIIYNLLAKKQYYFNNDVTDNVQTETLANIAYGGGENTGVIYSDLKPSIRLLKIIEAIEAEYTVANGYENPIVFSRDFFNTAEFTNLYMWLNADKDRLQGETQKVDFTVDSGSNINLGTDTGTFTIEPDSSWDFVIGVTGAFPPTGKEITISAYVDGVKTAEKTGVLTYFIFGSVAMLLEFSITSNVLIDKDVYIEVTGVNESVGVEWGYKKYSSSDVLSTDEVATGGNSLGNVVYVSENFPKIKIIDFLKGLFNMFKLVVVPQDDGTLYVDTLASYYGSGDVHDVTRYINFDSNEIERGDILNEIELKFQEPTTILNIQFEKNNGRGYGDEELKLKDDNGKALDGTSLTFTLPFEQIVYERLTDQATGNTTNIQYGAVIDEELEPANPKAHIFYNLVQSTVNSRIGFIDYLLNRTELNSLINTPFHHYGDILPTYSTTFKNEFSTWNGVSIDNNLYTRHYQDYILNIFNIKKRTFIYEANLPIHIITKLELNDTLKIKENYYRIDKYSYNLLSGKTTLTLINNFSDVIGESIVLDKNVISDYITKTEVTQVTNLAEASPVKTDNGWGTTWATVTQSGNNLEIDLDEFNSTNGDVRSMYVTISSSQKVFIQQTDKGYIPSMDFSNQKNSQYISLLTLRN